MTRSGAPRGVRMKGGSCPALVNSTSPLSTSTIAANAVTKSCSGFSRACHEKARGEALAGNVADEEENVLRVEHEAVVEVSAHGARRLEQRLEREALLCAEQLAGHRKQPHLDATRGVHLARHLRRLVAQHAPLALGLRERADDGAGEDRHRADRRPGEVEEHVQVVKRDDRGAEEQHHEPERQMDRLQRAHPRHVGDEEEPAEREHRRLDEGR